jgi:hypothetical protein
MPEKRAPDNLSGMRPPVVGARHAVPVCGAHRALVRIAGNGN